MFSTFDHFLIKIDPLLVLMNFHNYKTVKKNWNSVFVFCLFFWRVYLFGLCVGAKFETVNFNFNFHIIRKFQLWRQWWPANEKRKGNKCRQIKSHCLQSKGWWWKEKDSQLQFISPWLQREGKSWLKKCKKWNKSFFLYNKGIIL